MKNQTDKDNQKRVMQQYHDQIVFDLKRAFLQFITLMIIGKKPTYAFEIKAEIMRVTMGGFDIDRNNLYKKLRSLEKDGMLHSQMEPSNRGAQRKYYMLTPLGVRLLEKNSDLLLPLIESLRANINPGLS